MIFTYLRHFFEMETEGLESSIQISKRSIYVVFMAYIIRRVRLRVRFIYADYVIAFIVPFSILHCSVDRSNMPPHDILQGHFLLFFDFPVRKNPLFRIK